MSNTTKFKIPISPRNEDHLIWNSDGVGWCVNRPTPSESSDGIKERLDKLIEKVAKIEAKLWMWEQEHP